MHVWCANLIAYQGAVGIEDTKAYSVSAVEQLDATFRWTKECLQGWYYHDVMSPLEFTQRLTALVPRSHLIRFDGVLAPHAKLRTAIVPSPPENTTDHAADHAHGAHELGQAAQTDLRYRYRILPEMD